MFGIFFIFFYYTILFGCDWAQTKIKFGKILGRGLNVMKLLMDTLLRTNKFK